MASYNEAIEELQEWAREVFSSGCLLGDLARENAEELTEDEKIFLVCAREGFLAGVGQ